MFNNQSRALENFDIDSDTKPAVASTPVSLNANRASKHVSPTVLRDSESRSNRVRISLNKRNPKIVKNSEFRRSAGLDGSIKKADIRIEDGNVISR